MLKFNSFEVSRDYRLGYGAGARPAIAIAVEFQIGARSYETMTVKLPEDAVLRIVQAAVAEAVSLLHCDPASIDVAGKAGEPEAEPEAEPGTLSLVEAADDDGAPI